MGPELSQALRVCVERISSILIRSSVESRGTLRCKLYNPCKVVGNDLIIDTVFCLSSQSIQNWYR